MRTEIDRRRMVVMDSPGAIQAASVANVRIRAARLLNDIPVIAGFVLLTALASQVKVPLPFTAVPATLQLIAVLLAGMLLSPGLAAASMAAYAACGAAGLPVFAPGSSGIAGPTGGYILGFIAAAWVVAAVRGEGRYSVARLMAAGALGTATLFLCGAGGLLVWATAVGVDPASAVWSGTAPFWPKAAAELGVAASLVTAVRGLSRRFRG